MVADAISEKMARNIAQRTRFGGVGNQGHFDISGSDSSCPGGVANINLEKLIAAHGVTLTITSQDGACPTGPRQFRGTGHWTVTGGSGRFSKCHRPGFLRRLRGFNGGLSTIDLTRPLALAAGARAASPRR